MRRCSGVSHRRAIATNPAYLGQLSRRRLAGCTAGDHPRRVCRLHRNPRASGGRCAARSGNCSSSAGKSTTTSANLLLALAVLGIPIGMVVIWMVYLLLGQGDRRGARMPRRKSPPPTSSCASAWIHVERGSADLQALTEYGSLLQSCMTAEEALQLTKGHLVQPAAWRVGQHPPDPQLAGSCRTRRALGRAGSQSPGDDVGGCVLGGCGAGICTKPGWGRSRSVRTCSIRTRTYRPSASR